MSNQSNKRGFTIIEVVLVLAIAGLIFMMVFIALPALQRSQRDTQRKSDLSRAITAIGTYSSSNRGSLPTNWSTFETQYLTVGGDSFIDPAGANTSASSLTAYAFANNTGVLSGTFDSASTQNVIYYAVGYVCDAGGALKADGNRKVALRMYLEGGGIACNNN